MDRDGQNVRGDGSALRRVVDVLKERFPQSSKQTLKRMVEDGRVSVNGIRARRLADPVGSSDQLRVVDRPKRRDAVSLEPLELVYEDRDIVVVNKPSGLLTSTGPRERRLTALVILENYYARKEPKTRIGLIHRLDRDASGLLVFSKNDLAYESLKTQFFHHDVQRVYRAIVHDVPNPPAGTIESRLVEYADGTVHRTKASGKGQRAVTHYETVRTWDNFAELRVTLETGRKHQIRVHLASRGWAIVGDAAYGKAGGKRLMLAAVELGFAHPRSGSDVRFQISMPGEMGEFLG